MCRSRRRNWVCEDFSVFGLKGVQRAMTGISLSLAHNPLLELKERLENTFSNPPAP